MGWPEDRNHKRILKGSSPSLPSPAPTSGLQGSAVNGILCPDGNGLYVYRLMWQPEPHVAIEHVKCGFEVIFYFT